MSVVTYSQAVEDYPPRLMSGPLRSKLEDNSHIPIRLAKLTIAGTDYYLGDTGVAALDTGSAPYPVVRSWGSIGRSFPERSEQLQSVECDIEIDDQSLWFHRLVWGSSADSIRRSPAVLYYGAVGVSQPDWYTAFAGVIDSWQQVGQFIWRLRLRPNDRWMNGYMADDPINNADYPNAHKDVLGKRYPIIYGLHSSDGFGGGGFVPCYYVDTVNFKYLVCRGRAKSVDAVYSAGTVVASSDYTVSYTTKRNGKAVTEITFTADQGDNEITVDMHGYDSTGDGNGDLITNPADMLKHFIENWCYATYMSGAWLSGSAPLDNRSFSRAREFFSNFSFESARRYAGDRVRVIDAINNWATSNNCKMFWTNEGNLAIRINDHRPIRTYLGPEWWVRGNVEMAPGMTMAYDTLGIKDEVTIQFLYNEAGSAFKQTLKVKDLNSGENSADARDMRWSKSAVV